MFAVPSPSTSPDNNHLVIYELPTSWARYTTAGDVEMDTGTFADVQALFDLGSSGDRFKNVASISNEAILSQLGVNALELLPAADARPTGQVSTSVLIFGTCNFSANMSNSGDMLQQITLPQTSILELQPLWSSLSTQFTKRTFVSLLT